MGRILNLYELNKKRIALITKDYNELLINYEYRISPLKLPNHKKMFNNQSFPIRSTLLGGDISIELKAEKFLIVKLVSDKADFKKLYDVFLIICFFLGKELLLNYYIKNFPYYPVPRSYNLGEQKWGFALRKDFLLYPINYIEKGYQLIKDKETFFYKLLPNLLEINSISSDLVRFFCEYSLLEALSKSYQSSSFIFDKENNLEKYNKLRSLIEDFRKGLDSTFSEKEIALLENKVTLEKVNNKGVTNDRIRLFLSSNNISKYETYLGDWSTLRNKKGIGHGAIWFKDEVDFSKKEKNALKKMHELLTGLLYVEFRNFPR